MNADMHTMENADVDSRRRRFIVRIAG